MKTLALFDFDGTLYKKDSLIEFTKFSKGSALFYRNMLLLFPNLIAMKLRLLGNEKVKIKYISAFFKGMEIGAFESIARDFATNEIDKNLNPEIFKSYLAHLESGHDVYIVTASAVQWIAPWAGKYGVRVIGTKLETENGKLTGNFASKNCYGIEKVNRISEAIPLEDYQAINVYGSGRGDLEMLQLARNP
jgi:phosphatidylglycerophosphatase C